MGNSTPRAVAAQATRESVAAAYNKHGGNISAVSREIGITRKNVRQHLRKLGGIKKPIASGALKSNVARAVVLPVKGKVKRYILTSAQNNTYVHEPLWNNLLVLAKHYDAQLFVGTYSYNQNAFGKLAVKQGTKKEYDHELWFDQHVKPYITDVRVELGNDLVWCGEMNIIPTAVNPLSGLETYAHCKSAIFPHAKLAMCSIAVMQGSPVKFNYTTGTVTLKNYIQKKEGLKAEHHHVYSALIVEVDHTGAWFVRQLNADVKGNIQDLNVVVSGGKITTGGTVEAITWGDLHATAADAKVLALSVSMLDALKPKYQFLHDILEGNAINHHESNNPHAKLYTWLRGYHRLDAELEVTRKCIEAYDRPRCKTVVPDSNHDGAWLVRWLREYDYRKDPPNSELFLAAQSFMYNELRRGLMPRDVNITAWFMKNAGLKSKVKFLLADESYTICKGDIECGMHGHLGPNGAYGSTANLSKIGLKSNTAHTHNSGIFNGLYVAGTSTRLRWNYNIGPSAWNHSHIVTYKNGKRAIVTMRDGKWKA